MSEEIPEDAENKVEYCENCGKEMALKRGDLARFWLAPVIRLQDDAAPGGWDANRSPADEPLDEKCRWTETGW